MRYNKKSLTSFILALLLVFTPGLAVPAAESDSLLGVNILKNSGFEEVIEEEGITAGDGMAYADWQDGFVTLENENVYEGKHAVRIKKPGGVADKPWYRFPVRDFKPGALYEVSMMVNHDLDASEGGHAQILVEFYSGNTPDDSAGYIGGEGAGYVGGSSNNQWVEMKGTVQIPNNAAYVLVYCFLTSVGEVLVDNVSFSLSGGPEPYSFNTDQVFYYDDVEEGISTVFIDSFYTTEDEPYESTVDFSLMDGEKELASAKKVPFSEAGKAEYVFDLDLLKENETMYLIKAAVKDNKGEVIREYQSKVYKVPFPTALRREDGMFIDENGEEFIPSIAYHPISDFGKMAEIGVNVAEIGAYTVEGTRKQLDALQAVGMKAMVSLFCGPAWMQPAGHPQNVDLTREIVETFKDHPAIFAWCLCDEPMGFGITEERTEMMVESYRIVREIDKHYPIYIVDFNPDLYYESQKYCDVFAADIYTQHDMSPVTTRIRAAMEATERSNKPVYFIGKTYESNDAGLPDIDDVRGGNYRAFEEGAKGIGYYSLAKAIGHVGNKEPVSLDKTDLWEPMTQFAKEEQQELFDYFVHKKYPTFNVQNGTDVRSLYYTSWIHDNDLWVIVHNRGNYNITAEVPLVSHNGLIKLSGGNAKIIGGPGKDVKAENGKLVTEMGPQEVYLYKMAMSETPDTGILDLETTPNEESHDGTFSDLAGYGWAAEAIEAMFSAGIANETTVYSYSPGENITRGDFAMYLMRALGLSAEGESFADVAAEAPYAKEVITGRALGILEGVGENLFSPDAEISRQDMMKITARGMRYVRKLAEGGDAAVLEGFSDSASIADYAREDAAAMIGAGIIHGNADGTVNPLGKTTRAEAAVIMDRIIKTSVLPAPETPEEGEAGEEPEQEIVFAKETVSEEQAEKRTAALDALSKLGIAAFEDGTLPVTRAEAAELLVRSMGVTEGLAPAAVPFTDVAADHPASGYIEAVSSLGIMNGTGDGCFSPDRHVTYVQLVKMLVDALGYSAHAQALGGWSAGYMTQAAQLELTKNLTVQEDGAIIAAAAALLVRNALDIPIAQRASFGTDELKFVQTDGVTMLTAYHGLTKATGKITATSDAVIEAPRMLRRGEVAMGQTILQAGESGAENSLGQMVTVYTREDESDMPVIVLCEGKRNTEVLTIEGKNLIPDKSSSGALYWYDGGYKEHSERFASGAVLLYNGKAKSGFTGADFDITNGSVTLLMDGSGITTAIVEEYENYVVSSVSPSTNTISFSDGEPIVADVNDAQKRIRISDSKGKPIGISDFRKGNVLSIAKSEDGTIWQIVLSNNKVTGKITEVDTESVWIDGENYPIAENLRTPRPGYSVTVPALGQEAVYILDKNGQIAYVDTDSTVRKYAYLINMHKKEGISGEVALRIFTYEGKMEYPVLSEKVEFNGDIKTPEELFASSLLKNGTEVIQQLVRYDMNEEGKLIKLETAKSPAGMTENQRLTEFTRDYGPVADGAGRNRFVGYDQHSIAEYYRFDENDTPCFVVPSSPMEDKYYSLYNLVSITDNTTMPSISLYDVDENLVAGAIVSVVDSSVASAEPKFGNDLEYYVVSDVRQVLNAEGETTQAIAAFGNGGEVLLQIEPELEIVYNKLTNSTETGITKIRVDQVETGDILLCEMNSLTGAVKAASMVLRAGSPAKKEIGEQMISQFYTYSEAQHMYGDVVGVLDTGLHVKPAAPQWNRLYVWKQRSTEIPIYLCETKNGEKKITRITKADITETDTAWVGALRVFNRMMVIYRER